MRAAYRKNLHARLVMIARYSKMLEWSWRSMKGSSRSKGRSRGGKARNVLPGFGLSMGFAIVYLSLIVLIPLASVFIKTTGLTFAEFWGTVTNPRVLASYRISFFTAFSAAVVNMVFGLLDSVGAGTLPFSRQKIYRQPRRSSIRAADSGSGNCTNGNICPEWLGRIKLLAAAGAQGGLYATGYYNSPYLYRHSFRCPYGAASAAGSQ